MKIKHGIFKLQLKKGVLMGNNSNETCNTYFSSHAVRKTVSREDDEFIGVYHDTWSGSDNILKQATLEISKYPYIDIYTLVWENNKVIFRGVAQKDGDTLYGTYTSA